LKSIIKKPLNVWFGALLLLSFALAKLGTVVARHSGWLPQLPQSQLHDADVMLYAGIGELIGVVLIVFFLNVKQSCQLFAVIGIAFLIYRYFLFQLACPCMGAAPELIPWLKINQQTVLMTIPIFWLLLGLWGWARESSSESRTS